MRMMGNNGGKEGDGGRKVKSIVLKITEHQTFTILSNYGSTILNRWT
jgi:hypothetical protein